MSQNTLSKRIEQLIAEARERMSKLSPKERVSEHVLRGLGYVISETVMGVIEDAGNFEWKRQGALMSLRAMQKTLAGEIGEQSSLFMAEKMVSLLPEHRITVENRLKSAIHDLETMTQSEERAVQPLP